MCATLVLLHLYRDGIAAKIRAARHPTRHRGGRLRQRRVYIRGKEKGGESDDNTIYILVQQMRQHAERARHAVLFQRTH